MATISNIGGTGSSGYTAPVTAVTPTERLASGAQTTTPGVDAPLPFPTDPIDLNADGVVSQGEIAQSLRPREFVLPEAAPEQPALSTAAFAELAAPAEDAAAQEPALQQADAQDPAVQQQTTVTQQAAPEAPAEPPPPTTPPRAGATDTTSTATSSQSATSNGSAISDAESAVTSLLGELASRSYGAVQSPRLGQGAQPALSLVA